MYALRDDVTVLTPYLLLVHITLTKSFNQSIVIVERFIEIIPHAKYLSITRPEIPFR